MSRLVPNFIFIVFRGSKEYEDFWAFLEKYLQYQKKKHQESVAGSTSFTAELHFVPEVLFISCKCLQNTTFICLMYTVFWFSDHQKNYVLYICSIVSIWVTFKAGEMKVWDMTVFACNWQQKWQLFFKHFGVGLFYTDHRIALLTSSCHGLSFGRLWNVVSIESYSQFSVYLQWCTSLIC